MVIAAAAKCEHRFGGSLDRDWLDRLVSVCDECGSVLEIFDRDCDVVDASDPADSTVVEADDSFDLPWDWVYGERC